MNRKIFGITEFRQEGFPDYPCPYCGSHLALSELSKEDDAETKSARTDPDFDYDWVRQLFRADLKCTSPRCGERVLCVGSGRVDHFSGPIDEEWVDEYLDLLTPHFFLPALQVFEIPPNTPKEVRTSVEASFKVLFLSSRGALNEVRNALEFLMDHLKVPRKNDGGKTLTLHSRVEKMSGAQGTYRDQLLAVKWLGNAGTHAEPTQRADVLDAYEILHNVLDGMFSGRADRIRRLVDGINAQKGIGPLAPADALGGGV